MPVDRCICHDISFTEIKKIAIEKGYISIEEIQKAGVSSTSCKMCEPYVKLMLETGKTSFVPGIHLK